MDYATTTITKATHLDSVDEARKRAGEKRVCETIMSEKGIVGR